MTTSSELELHLRLTESETKRAQLVVENQLLKEEVERLRVDLATRSPSPRRANPAHRQSNPSGLEEGTAPAGGVGFISVEAVPQANERDLGFTEEDYAKQCAEEIMSRLLRATHAQRDAEDRLADAQQELVRLRSQLDESRGRELVLSQMASAYSESVRERRPEGGHSSTPSSRSDANSSTRGQLSVNATEQWLQQSVKNLERLDGVKRRLIDEKLREAEEENAALKQKVQMSTAPAGASPSTSGAPRWRSATSKVADDNITAIDVNGGLVSEERQMLLKLLEREKVYQGRMESLKHLVLEREKTVQDLRRLLAQAQQRSR